MNTRPQIIAIDGPAASGKSTLGRRLAAKLSYLYFDTGVMYRAVALASLERGLDLHDPAAVTALAEQLAIDVRPPSKDDGRSADVTVDGADVTWNLRLPEVDNSVSIVAAYPGVRRAMTAIQRRIGLRGDVVMVGRDIGTVVLPEANLKIYLDASVEERARRRYQEVQGRNQSARLEAIRASMQERDHLDSTREMAPLKPAADAVIIDSDGMDPDEVLEAALTLFEQRSETGRRSGRPV